MHAVLVDIQRKSPANSQSCVGAQAHSNVKPIELRFDGYIDRALHEISQPGISVSHDLHEIAVLGYLLNENALKLTRTPFGRAGDKCAAFPELAIAFESARSDLDLPRCIPLAMANVSVVNADQQALRRWARTITVSHSRELIGFDLAASCDGMAPDCHTSRSSGTEAKHLHDSRCFPVGHSSI